MAASGRKVWSIVLQVIGGLVAAGLLILGLMVASGHAQEADTEMPNAQAGDGSEATVLGVDDTIYGALSATVAAWRAALVSGDPARVAAFALPEYADEARSALKDPGSDLYRVLLAEDSALRRLAGDGGTSVALFANTTPYDPERGVTACLYDATALHVNRGDDRRALLDMAQGPNLVCEPFFEAGGKWRADYETASAAPEGDLDTGDDPAPFAKLP